MKFYIFTKGERTVPSSRYRAYYLAESLREIGYEVDVMPANDHTFAGFTRYLRTLAKVERTDVVYLQRTVYNKYFSLALLIMWVLGLRFVMDFDDAVYEHSPRKTALFVRLAEFVTCGSEKIRSWSLRHNPRSYVLTNSVPLDIYTMRAHEPSDRPVIGWIGSLPFMFLPPVLPAIEALARRGVDFEFRIIGAMGDTKIREMTASIPNVTIIDSLNWSDPREAVAEIKKFTVGIMTLRDTEWDQVKYFKALEYMACGVPVVASRGITISEILTRAGAGHLAGSTDEWVAALTRVLADPTLRDKDAAVGRQEIERRFSTAAVAKEFLRLVSEARG